MPPYAPVPKLQLSQLYTSVRGPSFRHGLPESSHKDVNLGAGNFTKSGTCASGKLPSMALDSGIHAGMTVFSRSVGLVYNDE
ncbi:MAG: hypothetical protein NTX45_05165, partial [Proteobacteria bacterium]|nr:hypothetical protein [Pseudomonadota bacterium]